MVTIHLTELQFDVLKRRLEGDLRFDGADVVHLEQVMIGIRTGKLLDDPMPPEDLLLPSEEIEDIRASKALRKHLDLSNL